MLSQIYIINGYPRSGKTTFGELVSEILHEQGIAFGHLSSITLVKALLAEDLDSGIIPELHSEQLLNLKRKLIPKVWDWETKDDFWRLKMSEMKALIMEEYPKLLDEWVLGRAQEFDVLFVDIREEEAMEMFERVVEETNLVCSVKRLRVKSNMEIIPDNPSDMAVEEIDYDIEIKNDREGRKSLQDFRETARGFVRDHITSHLSGETESCSHHLAVEGEIQTY